MRGPEIQSRLQRMWMSIIHLQLRQLIVFPVATLGLLGTLMVMLAVPSCHSNVCKDTPNNPVYLVGAVSSVLQTVTKIPTVYDVYTLSTSDEERRAMDMIGSVMVERFDSLSVTAGVIDTSKVHRLIVSGWKDAGIIGILFDDGRKVRPLVSFFAGDSLITDVETILGYPGIITSLCWTCYPSRIKDDLGILIRLFAAANPKLMHGHTVQGVVDASWKLAGRHVEHPLDRRSHGVLFGLCVFCCIAVVGWYVTLVEESVRRARSTRQRYLDRKIVVGEPQFWRCLLSWSDETFLRWYEQNCRRQQRAHHQQINAAKKASRDQRRQQHERELERLSSEHLLDRSARLAECIERHGARQDIEKLLAVVNDVSRSLYERRQALLQAEATEQQCDEGHDVDVVTTTNLRLSYEQRLRHALVGRTPETVASHVRAEFVAALSKINAPEPQRRIRALETAVSLLHHREKVAEHVEEVTSTKPRFTTIEDFERILDLGSFLPDDIDVEHATKIVTVLLAVGQRGQSAFNARYRQLNSVQKRVAAKLQAAYRQEEFEKAIEYFRIQGIVVMLKKGSAVTIGLNSHKGNGAGRNKKAVVPTAEGSTIIQRIVPLLRELRQETEC